MKLSSHFQTGTSMIEVLITIVLGSIITLSLINLFVSNKSTYKLHDGVAHLQNTARLVIAYFNRELRIAGFNGCTNLSMLTPSNIVSNPPASMTLTNDRIIRGYEATSTKPAIWNPALPASIANSVVPGTDVITIYRASTSSEFLTKNMTDTTSPVEIDNTLLIKDDEILLITDCGAADIFKVTGIVAAKQLSHDLTGNISDQLSKAYQTDATISRLEPYTYYVKNTGRTNEAGHTIFGLFRMDANGEEVELADGVDNLQLQYGIDTDGNFNVDSYQKADAIESNADWDKVMSTNMALLVTTVEDVHFQGQAYKFDGVQYSAPSDKIIRREWISYINLRNR